MTHFNTTTFECGIVISASKLKHFDALEMKELSFHLVYLTANRWIPMLKSLTTFSWTTPKIVWCDCSRKSIRNWCRLQLTWNLSVNSLGRCHNRTAVFSLDSNRKKMYVNICCLERKRKSVDRLNCNFVAAFFRFLFFIVINDENVLKLPEPYECTCTNVFFSHWNEIECSVHSIAMHVFEHVKKKNQKNWIVY